MFIAYVKGEGEGCDYTIGCNQTLWKLKANTYDEAIEELKHDILGEWCPKYNEYEEGYWDEQELAGIHLFEVKQEYIIPVKDWYKDALKIKDEAIQQAKQKAEKLEYERLKGKFE